MAKKDSDLFERLRRVGVRKQVARTLSEIGDGANEKALRAARGAVGELRSLAEEIERRLPSVAKDGAGPSKTATTQRASAPAARKASATAPAAGGARAPRGQNKAKILAALRGGPKTASEVASETGIGTGTVSSTLTKLASAGEVVKAERGYALPK